MTRRLAACSIESLADIVARFLRRGHGWPSVPEKVALRLNDTRPATPVAESRRILLDQAGLGWDGENLARARPLALLSAEAKG